MQDNQVTAKSINDIQIDTKIERQNSNRKIIFRKSSIKPSKRVKSKRNQNRIQKVEDGPPDLALEDTLMIEPGCISPN